MDSILDRVRSSPAAKRMIHGPVSYPNAVHDLELALQIDRFPFAMEVSQKNEELIARAVRMDER